MTPRAASIILDQRIQWANEKHIIHRRLCRLLVGGANKIGASENTVNPLRVMIRCSLGSINQPECIQRIQTSTSTIRHYQRQVALDRK
jgi:hypothetical protein